MRVKTVCKWFQPVEWHAVESNNCKTLSGASEIKLWFSPIYLQQFIKNKDNDPTALIHVLYEKLNSLWDIY